MSRTFRAAGRGDGPAARDDFPPPTADGQPKPNRLQLPVRLAGGAVCCTSGGALVLHILTGSPLWLGLAAVGFATSALLAVAIVAEGIDVRVSPELRRLVGRGSIVGLVATVVYDVSRWILVQLGGMQVSPFEALPLFGQALLGSNSDGFAVQTAGTAYHLLNGVAFAIAYVIWLGHRHWAFGIAFALVLEAFMLGLYPGWLDPRSVAELTQMSLVGHVAYGAALGLMTKLLAPTGSRQHA